MPNRGCGLPGARVPISGLSAQGYKTDHPSFKGRPVASPHAPVLPYSVMPLPDHPNDRPQSPEEWGFPSDASVQQRAAWHNQERFLAEFARSGRAYRSAETIGLTPQAYQRWMSIDLFGFKKRLYLAEQQYLEKLEAEADRRAVEGTDHPVIYKGEITATYKEYSDNLLMFRMKKLDPQYKDNYAPIGGVTKVQVTQIIINAPPGASSITLPVIDAEVHDALDAPPGHTHPQIPSQGAGNT